MDRSIPKELWHLKVDPRGYPIPYFVPIVDGKPLFNRLDERKQHLCIDEKRCPICGFKLNKDYNYVITGPVGYKNRTVTDPPMHRVCAEYTLATCPHLYFERADRVLGIANNPLAMQEKPSEIRLIRISKFKDIKAAGRRYVQFTPVDYQAYRYIDGELTWTPG